MTLDFDSAAIGGRPVDYRTAWDRQRALHSARADGRISDVVVLLEHEPVYTAGKRTQPEDRPVDGTPVIEVDRGGKITWHGPGQLVGYPIVRLPSDVYVVDYVRRIEEALVRVCRDFGLPAGRVSGRSGVWLPAEAERPERKVAALGVRVSRGVTMHGFALNCDCTLAGFDAIVPCGISDAAVTTLTAELGRVVSVTEALPVVEHHVADLLSWAPYVRSPDLTRPGDVLGTSSRGPVSYGLEPLRS